MEQWHGPERQQTHDTVTLATHHATSIWDNGGVQSHTIITTQQWRVFGGVAIPREQRQNGQTTNDHIYISVRVILPRPKVGTIDSSGHPSIAQRI
jgi:hypothetical protein